MRWHYSCSTVGSMSSKARLFTLVAGAAALAGLTYGFGRLALRPRSLGASSSAQRAPLTELKAEASTPEAWERALVAQSAPSDALDLALDLDGIFAASADTSGVTARSSDRVPPPSSGDDGDPPSPDSLGRAWLSQATQSERSFTETDLSLSVEDLAAPEDSMAAFDDEDRTSYA